MRADTLKVIEIYQSIQGESSLAGQPCTFVRLAGCPLRCRWCDTVYSFEGGFVKSIPDILLEVKKLSPKIVELTGGEPLAQENCIDLIKLLISENYRVMIETGGSESIETMPGEVHIVMDIKCPGSGMEKKNKLSNLAFMKSSDDLKFVVASKSDFDWAVAFIKEHQIQNKMNLLVSPAWGLVDPKDLVTWILQAPMPLQLNLQIHKYIWGPRVKGV